jgi:PKD repeat protein
MDGAIDLSPMNPGAARGWRSGRYAGTLAVVVMVLVVGATVAAPSLGGGFAGTRSRDFGARPSVAERTGTTPSTSPPPPPPPQPPAIPSDEVSANPCCSNASLPMWRAAVTATAPPARADAAMAFDFALNATVLFGGYTTGGSCPIFTDCAVGDTWEFQDGAWSNLTPMHPTSTNTPSDRWGAAMTYDPQIGGLLMFGGITTATDGFNNPGLNDTWEFVRGAWSPVCSLGCAPPVDRWDAALTYDVDAGSPVLFGGESTVSGATTALNDTWTFSPTTNWTELDPTVSPSARYAAGFAYDHQTGGAVLFGGIPANSETWLFRNASWYLLTPVGDTGTPSARGGVSMASDPLNGTVVLFGGCAELPCTGAGLNDTWVLDEVNWYNLTARIGAAPPARDLARLVATSSRGALLLFGGASRSLQDDSWWLAHIEVSQVTATPGAVDVGVPTTLSVNVTGGFGPQTVSWEGLPSGCTSANVTVLNCTANASSPTPASIFVTATDPVGESVESIPTDVAFNARPSVTLGAMPLEGIAPLQVSFTAGYTGGTGSVNLSWQFGDSSPGTGPNPTHTYATAGTYTVTVWANDSDLASGSAHTTVTVHSRLEANGSFSSASIVLRHSTTLVLEWSGGVPPYTLTPVGRLPNCTSEAIAGPPTEAEYSCAPNASGHYEVQVWVNDSSGQARNVTANLSVAPAAGTVAPPSGGLTSTQEFLLTLAVALVIAVAIGLYLFGRRREPSVVPPATPKGPIPTGNLYVPPEDAPR